VVSQPRETANGASDRALRVIVTRAPDGTAIASGMAQTDGRHVMMRRRLWAGDYTLTARIAAAKGAIRTGGDRCSGALRVPPAAAVTATVVGGAAGPCFIRVGYVSFADLAGRTVAAASTAARRRGFQLRVVRRNGLPLPHTEDLRYDRVNVAVVGGRVRGIKGIY